MPLEFVFVRELFNLCFKSLSYYYNFYITFYDTHIFSPSLNIAFFSHILLLSSTCNIFFLNSPDISNSYP